MTWTPAQVPRGLGSIRLERKQGFAEVFLDNPARRNAVSPGMMWDLGEVVAALEAECPAAVILRGQGTRAFCAGGDLKAVQAHLLDGDTGRYMCRWMTDLLNRLQALRGVVIGAVSGSALGGGAEILTACDVVVAGQDATVGFVHAQLGVSPGWGGGARLRERIGSKKATQVLTEARRLTATEALSLGIVDEVTADPMERAQERALHLASHPLEAVAVAKQVGRGTLNEEEGFVSLWGGRGHRAALASSK